MDDIARRAREVRLMIFDVDGVLTDGTLYLLESGEELKAFHSLDGQGIKSLAEGGVEIALISARRSAVVERRAQSLGIAHVHQGAEDKLTVFLALHARLGVDASACGYMGDDLLDLPVLRRVGLAVTVPEAPSVVRTHAHYVTRAYGGRGAAREVCDLILAAQGTLERIQARYLE